MPSVSCWGWLNEGRNLFLVGLNVNLMRKHIAVDLKSQLVINKLDQYKCNYGNIRLKKP